MSQGWKIKSDVSRANPVLFEIFDFNESSELDAAELQFLMWSSIEGLKKVFELDDIIPPEYLESYVDKSLGTTSSLTSVELIK